jgi:hypothetical protein
VDVSPIPAGYGELLAVIRDCVRTGQVRSHLAASREMLLVYWQIGRAIVLRQKVEGWGKAGIERLATDIQREFPGIEGFSANNVWRMRAFYLAYAADSHRLARRMQVSAQQDELAAETSILAQAVQELDSPPEIILNLTWSHNII